MARARQASEDAELAAEQTYFDEALECRERQREGLSQAPTAAPHKGPAAGLKRLADEAISSLRPPDEAVAFGRFDYESDESWYVGYNAIWSEGGTSLSLTGKRPWLLLISKRVMRPRSTYGSAARSNAMETRFLALTMSSFWNSLQKWQGFLPSRRWMTRSIRACTSPAPAKCKTSSRRSRPRSSR
jgi:hypothetical protein